MLGGRFFMGKVRTIFAPPEKSSPNSFVHHGLYSTRGTVIICITIPKLC